MQIVDKDSRIPAYVQLMNIIIEQIENGDFKENNKLPAERELCDFYKISRTTVRQAIRELEKDRYIYIQHGKGTFVSPKRFEQELIRFYSFSEYMKKLGMEPSTRVVDFTSDYCNEKIAQKLGRKVGEKIFIFTRLRLADNEPMMLVKSYIPGDRFPDFDRSLLESGSLYETFMTRYNVVFSRAEENLQAVSTRRNEAELLKTKVGFPSMMIERVTYERDSVVEYAIGIARGDRFKYDIILYQ